MNSKGVILIEFAVCMPVLIILLFYINDLVRIKRYYSQTEFVAQQMANILQNISQNRTDKKISILDLKHAGSLAYLSIYPGKTMYINNVERFSHDPYYWIYYVKGLTGGKASCVWCRYLYGYAINTPNNRGCSSSTSDDSYRMVRWGTNVTPSSIYPSLKINEGEVKIIIECAIYNGSSRMNGGDYATQPIRSQKAFGIRLVTPRTRYSNGLQGRYFPSVVIFTPKPGLFNETGPQ